MFQSVCAISLGAVFGSLTRWGLGLGLNAYFPTMPLGTLAANLIGGYFIGIFLFIFASLPSLAPEWQLFIITGFLGSLTTFSTFSAEVTTLIQQQRFAWAFGVICLHVLGSLLFTSAGFATAYFFKR